MCAPPFVKPGTISPSFPTRQKTPRHSAFPPKYFAALFFTKPSGVALLPLGALAQSCDAGPELPPGFAFVLRQLLQRVRVADAGQVRVPIPAGECAGRPRLRVVRIGLFRPGGEVGPPQR
jgi:hypothetical protein